MERKNMKNDGSQSNNSEHSSPMEQQYFWVSYSEDKKEDKKDDAGADSLLERSNRFAL